MRQTMHLLIFLLAALLPSPAAKAATGTEPPHPASHAFHQGWRVYHYDNRDGLSHNSIKCIFEDSKGFMWFGTKNGLNRFDGQEFRKYVYDGKPGGLRSSIIFDMLEDDDLDLWVATADGISIYSPKEDSFRSLEEAKKTTADISGIVWKIKKDSEGCIWILSQDGVYTYFNGEVTNLTDKISQHMKTLPENMFIEGATAFFANTDGKVICCDKFCKRILSVTNIPSPIWAIEGYGSDKLLLGTQKKGLWVADVKNNTSYQMAIAEGKPLNHEGLLIYSVCKVNEQEYWVGCEAGLLVVNDNEMYPFPHETIYSGELEADVPRAIFLDSHKNVWIGNNYGGIDCFIPNLLPFKCMVPSKIDARCGKRIACFAEDNEGRLWIGTDDNGLCSFDLSTGQLTPVMTSEGKPLTGFSIQCLKLISDDELLIGSTTEGIYKLNIHTGLLSHLVKEGDVYSMLVDKNGNLWAGIHSDLCIFNKETGAIEVFKPEVNTFTHDIIEDAHGNIWAMAMSQVCRISLSDYSLKRFSFDKESKTTDYHGSVITGFCDSKGNLWFGFEEGGLYLFNEEDETLKKVIGGRSSVGIGVYSIVEDKSGSLWLGTNIGLLKFDPESQTIAETYDMNDGLPTKQINYRAGAALSSGDLVFGTTEGFFMFDPLVVSRESLIDDITFVGFYVGDENIVKSISDADTITLRNDQSTFTISFSTLNYSTKGISYVAYQLKGFDKEWNSLNDINRISYHNVPPGNYTFCIHSIPSFIEKDDVDKGGPIATLHIRILPKWYQTLTARLMMIAALGIVTALIAWLFIKQKRQKAISAQIEQEKENEQKLYRAKIDFFTHVAHEIRTPTSLIKDPVQRLRAKELPQDVDDTLAIVERNAEVLNSLVNELLDFRKFEETHITLKEEPADMSQLVRSSWNRYAPYAASNGLHTTLTLPESPVTALIDAKATARILDNLFSNAIKYASTYIRITLTADAEKELACLTISNDGARIPSDMKEKIFEPFVQLTQSPEVTNSSGIGLALASSLSHLQKGTLFLNDKAADNEFILYLPLTSPTETEKLPAESALSEKPEELPLPADAEAAARATVLIVEDSADMRHYLASVLKDNFSVLEAADGIEALEELGKSDVDLMVTDVMMPRKDGFELCREVKSSVETCHIPVVILTAKDMIKDRIAGLEYGADAYIPKPFSSDFLEAQIRNLLENRTRLQNKYAHNAEENVDILTHNKSDRDFLERITREIGAHLSESEYTTDDLSAAMAMSRSTLTRKIKSITGQTPGNFISLIRLKKAAELLCEGSYRVNEVCMMVGFNSIHHFSAIFKKQFGITPGAYAASVRKE